MLKSSIRKGEKYIYTRVSRLHSQIIILLFTLFVNERLSLYQKLDKSEMKNKMSKSDDVFNKLILTKNHEVIEHSKIV